MTDRPEDPGTGGSAWWTSNAGQPEAGGAADAPAWLPPRGGTEGASPAVTVTPGSATPPPTRPGATQRAAVPAKPPKRRRRRFARFLAWTACILSVLILVGSLVGYLALQNLVNRINHIDVLGSHPKGTPAAHGSENFLLVGSDAREGLSRSEQARLHTGSGDYGQHSDTMILAHISHDGGGHATLVSLPRDSLVEVPEWTDPKTHRVHPEHKSKLNAAYSLGGPALTVATIERATGVRIDHYVEVNFTGFLKMVNAIGGVDVCIPENVARRMPDRDSGLNLPAGKSHIKGPQALAYVRARHIYPNQDLGRIQAQQKFVGAMIRQTLSAGTISNPLKIKHLLDAIGDSLTTDRKFGSSDLLRLATSLRNFSPSHVTFATVPVADANYRVPGLGSTLLWDTVAAHELFTEINQDKGGVLDSRNDKTLHPNQVTVQVLNGSGKAGVGATTKRELTASGFLSAGPAKTADQPSARTTIRYSGQDAAAKALAKAVPNAAFEKVDGLGDTVELIIGSDFTGTTHLAPTPTPSGQPTTRSAADTSCT